MYYTFVGRIPDKVDESIIKAEIIYLLEIIYCLNINNFFDLRPWVEEYISFRQR